MRERQRGDLRLSQAKGHVKTEAETEDGQAQAQQFLELPGAGSSRERLP
jgi:hypothetical protein